MKLAKIERIIQVYVSSSYNSENRQDSKVDIKIFQIPNIFN